MKICIDTRENLPLDFRRSSNVEDVKYVTLHTGDYSIEGYENNIAIERKSPADLFQTLGRGHERFKRELERAVCFDYFAIIVERPFKEIYEKDFENAHRTQMRGDVIIKILMTLKIKYGIDVIFCNGREEASSIIRQTFIAYLNWKEAEKHKPINGMVRGLKKKWGLK